MTEGTEKPVLKPWLFGLPSEERKHQFNTREYLLINLRNMRLYFGSNPMSCMIPSIKCGKILPKELQPALFQKPSKGINQKGTR